MLQCTCKCNKSLRRRRRRWRDKNEIAFIFRTNLKINLHNQVSGLLLELLPSDSHVVINWLEVSRFPFLSSLSVRCNAINAHGRLYSCYTAGLNPEWRVGLKLKKVLRKTRACEECRKRSKWLISMGIGFNWEKDIEVDDRCNISEEISNRSLILFPDLTSLYFDCMETCQIVILISCTILRFLGYYSNSMKKSFRICWS